MIDFDGGRWEGLDGLGQELLRQERPRAERGVMQGAIHLENQVKRTLTGARSGRIYRVSKKGAVHVASAPGEPPAVLYGNLRNSVGHSDLEWETPWVVVVLVGPGLGQKPRGGAPDPSRSYARRLEYGGVDSRGVLILPRPYMEPTVQRERATVHRLMEAPFR